MPTPQDLSGQRFGKWLVVQRAPSAPARPIRWYCECGGCGDEHSVVGATLKNGTSSQCIKCVGRGLRSPKGYKRPSLWKIWYQMHRRCEHVKDEGYHNYGARGIKVCGEWNDFVLFYHWALANGYEIGLSIERINNDGNYCPENCTWIPCVRQSRNTRRNRHISINGKTMLLVDWARLVGIGIETMGYRIARWPESRWLEPPHRKSRAT